MRRRNQSQVLAAGRVPSGIPDYFVESVKSQVTSFMTRWVRKEYPEMGDAKAIENMFCDPDDLALLRKAVGLSSNFHERYNMELTLTREGVPYQVDLKGARAYGANAMRFTYPDKVKPVADPERHPEFIESMYQIYNAGIEAQLVMMHLSGAFKRCTTLPRLVRYWPTLAKVLAGHSELGATVNAAMQQGTTNVPELPDNLRGLRHLADHVLLSSSLLDDLIPETRFKVEIAGPGDKFGTFMPWSERRICPFQPD